MRIVDEKKPGLSHAREAGIGTARYGIVIFVDDDNWLEANYVSIAHDVMEQHQKIGAIGAFISPEFEVPPPPWFQQMQCYYAIGPQGPREGDITDLKPHVAGAGMVLRKSAYQELKRRGFKPLLMDRQGGMLTSGGDTEICHALALIGYRIMYEPRLQLVHFMPAARLTKNYLLKLAHGIRTAEPMLAGYEIAWRGADASVLKFYVHRVFLLGSWLLKDAVKFLLRRASWLHVRIALGNWFQCVSDYGLLCKVLRDDFPRIRLLKERPPAAK